MASHARFGALEWTRGGHPLERKKAAEDALTLLTFEPGFEDPNWCTNGHVIHVLEGCLGLKLDGQELRVDAGDACRVEQGERHRAFNAGEQPVKLFVWSY